MQYGTKGNEYPISIYNPYKEVLHIREIFTTEDFLSLKGASITNSKQKNKKSNENYISDVSEEDRKDVNYIKDDKEKNNEKIENDNHKNIVVPSSLLTKTEIKSENITSSFHTNTLWSVEPGEEKEIIVLSMSADAPGKFLG